MPPDFYRRADELSVGPYRYKVTGGTVQNVYANEAKNTAKTTSLPNRLTLSDDGILTLIENAPAKSLSCKACILVDTANGESPPL